MKGSDFDIDGEWYHHLESLDQVDEVMLSLEEKAADGDATQWRVHMARERIYDIMMRGVQ